MFCGNCGNRLNDTDLYCPNCGHQNIVNNKVIVSNSNDGDSRANTLCVISLILTYFISIPFGILEAISPSLKHAFDGIIGLGPIVGFILMIIARVKYPNSKFAKVLMWIYIISIIVWIILTILVLIACSVACSGLGNMG